MKDLIAMEVTEELKKCNSEETLNLVLLILKKENERITNKTGS